MHNTPEVSVSDIAGRVKRTIEENFGYVRVRGEISVAKVNAASGHCYLTLKDDKACLEAVCWRGTYQKLAHKPQAGMEVIATGKLTTYAASSKYQLVIDALEPAGIGALMAMLEARKVSLAAEGLFDAGRKKPLPFLPEVIGIVTSPTGAVIRDMLHRLADRFPRRVLLWSVPVQGAGAAEKIAEAIAGFNLLPEGGRVPCAALTPAAGGSAPGLGMPGLRRPDVIIVARGGGSIEDLWAFNEEVVVRAVAASRIPLISAVGHETDTTLIDYAADRRAPTPTAAAELAVPVRAELLSRLDMLHVSKSSAMRKLLHLHGERIAGLARGLPRPGQLVQSMAQALDALGERLGESLPRLVERKRERLHRLEAGLQPRYLQQMLAGQQARVEHLGALLESLNVLRVLQRGFALVKDASGQLVTAAAAIAPGAALSLTFHDGEKTVVAAGAPRARATKPQQKGLFDDQ